MLDKGFAGEMKGTAELPRLNCCGGTKSCVSIPPICMPPRARLAEDDNTLVVWFPQRKMHWPASSSCQWERANSSGEIFALLFEARNSSEGFVLGRV